MFAPSLVDYFLEVVIADPVGTPVRSIAHRVPALDRPGFPLPDGVRYFCLPDKIDLRDRALYEKTPKFHAFTLTGGDGSRAYGFALTTYSHACDATLCLPRVFCFISHFALFGLFKEALGWIYHAQATEEANPDDVWLASPRAGALAFLEANPANNNHSSHDDTPATSWRDAIVDLVRRAPAPVVGATTEFYIHGQLLFQQTLHTSGLGYVDDACYQLLFQHLSIKNIIFILNCMLLEQRILIHSSHHGLLTPVCEALCALLYPFAWEHVYIPLLPMKLIEYLQAPVPFFMGVHTSYLTTKSGADVFASCVVIHLDKDKVVRPIHGSHGLQSALDHPVAKFPPTAVSLLQCKVQAILDLHQPIASAPTADANRVRSRRNARTSDVLRIDDASSEVDVTFGPGPLGITFEPTHVRLLATGADVAHPTSAVVKAFPQLQNGLPGPAALSGVLHIGSFLLSVNGVSTLSLSFEATCDLLRTQPRPLRLRFQNAPRPFPNACRFAARVQTSAFLSVAPVPKVVPATTTPITPWVDPVRVAFAGFFVDLFRGYAQYIVVTPTPAPQLAAPRSPQHSRRNSRQRQAAVAITFDADAFLGQLYATTTTFYRAFFETQAFQALINDTALGSLEQDDGVPAPALDLFLTCCADDVSSLRACLGRDVSALTRIITWQFPAPVATTNARRKVVMAIDVDHTTDDIRGVDLLVETAPAKRASATRQLEMMICGAIERPELDGPPSVQRRRRSMNASSMADLDNELASGARSNQVETGLPSLPLRNKLAVLSKSLLQRKTKTLA
ncbi:hypothetical protein SDRG_00190 [Saprolegnia diclina VS20]|uniref:UDENN domain-containing protein n=1 Tax=Saprolegnia diclina (strain VS20) TaxID=1156394 RepID=T0R7P1_SAPDV|nr:hypothetical protein SDRG_00190 [Saprolegnia diclina VS20]EQC42455.1 hypothetical protein SDRG_00190 [Saprolegnia diclina VS20]|eukprot:XP_008603878.1 hypothetical protein SDRG_00190 [Saprolegnia diclina VS20]